MTPQPKRLSPLTLVQTQKQEITCHHCESDKFVKKRKSDKGYQIYICKSCGRHFTYNPDKIQFVINPEAEYKKDVWDCRNLGICPGVGRYNYRLTFLNISQPWLMDATKRYIKFTLSTLSFSSGSEKLLAIKRLSRFLAISYPNISPRELDRSVIIDFLAHFASTKLSTSTRCHTIGGIRGFLEMSYQNQWLDVSRYLIRDEDFPKRPKPLPRYIPEDVMQQLNQHLEHLPEPVMRMVLVLQECGMRISELLHLKPDCLLQDKAGDWFMRYYQFKMKKEITIPISREVVQVIQEQLRYIKENLNIKFEYVFSSNEGGGWKGDFKPAPELMSRQAFSRYLNKLGESHNICDASGKRWHFLPHQFRHTVGTRMINNGVPQHIIQRYLGHESPNMTAVYAHIHDQTMKEEIAKYQGKIVNISGLVVEANNIEADMVDLQWFKKNIHAQALPNGSCALPTISQGCPHANACLTCTHFRTTSEYLAEHKQQLEQTNQIIQKAEANGWMRQIEMNQKIKTNLENIISVLEVDANDG
ncbi:MAG: tyrosine-type recombinase/integrase [Nostoc sp.]|uniref:tyrosine-type recombinase/integrase n=1 Tax=Nostoc sp. TaxID=1180 RepID=UPI002FFC4947